MAAPSPARRPTPPPPRRGLPACALLVPLLLATALVYWPGLDGPLLLDDLANLEVLSAWEQGEATAADVITGYGDQPLGRPVAMASFLAGQALHGASVFDLKYHNLLIHLLCGTLVFWLAGRLLDRPGLAPGAPAWWLALWAAAFWLTAPLLVSTVLYTVQRMAQLAALFSLAGLLLYVAGRDLLPRRPRTGWGLIGLTFLLCWPLATLAKENGALLPLLVVVVEVFFLGRGEPARRPLVLVLAATTVLPALAAGGYLAAHWPAMEAGYGARDFGPGERLLTQGWVLADYLLGFLSLPGASPPGLYRDDWPVLTDPLSPPFPLLILAAWVGVAAAAFGLRRRPACPLLGGVVFFLAAHLVESTLLPLDLYFEHRNYLPGVGLVLGIAAGVAALLHRRRLRPLLAAGLTLTVVLNLFLTATRAEIWSSKAALLDHHLHAHPESLRTHSATVNYHLAAGNTGAALEHMARVRQAARGTGEAAGAGLQDLAVRCHAGLPTGAGDWPDVPLTDRPYTVATLNMLISAVEGGHCPDFPAADFLTWLEGRARFTRPSHALGLALARGRLAVLAHRPGVAARHFLAAHRLRPGPPGPALRAVTLLLEAGEHRRARSLLERLAPRAAGWAPVPRAAYARLVARTATGPAGHRRDRRSASHLPASLPPPSGGRH